MFSHSKSFFQISIQKTLELLQIIVSQREFKKVECKSKKWLQMLIKVVSKCKCTATRWKNAKREISVKFGGKNIFFETWKLICSIIWLLKILYYILFDKVPSFRKINYSTILLKVLAKSKFSTPVLVKFSNKLYQ